VGALLSYGKLRMLEFYYDFVYKYLERDSYQLMEMDTDSLYLAISRSSLEECIKTDLGQEFQQIKHLWFPNQLPGKQKDRTPGLFKIEFEGDAMVALNSKTHFARTPITQQQSCSNCDQFVHGSCAKCSDKNAHFSAKGVIRRQNVLNSKIRTIKRE
jgi:hypothetical protein